MFGCLNILVIWGVGRVVEYGKGGRLKVGGVKRKRPVRDGPFDRRLGSLGYPDGFVRTPI